MTRANNKEDTKPKEKKIHDKTEIRRIEDEKEKSGSASERASGSSMHLNK